MSIEGSAFITIATGILTKSYTVTGLTLGTNYDFVVEARNSVGYSPISDSVSILHAIPPDAPLAPTTANLNQDIILSWVAPSDNGAEILSYKVVIRESDLTTYTESTAICDGSDSTII